MKFIESLVVVKQPVIFNLLVANGGNLVYIDISSAPIVGVHGDVDILYKIVLFAF